MFLKKDGSAYRQGDRFKQPELAKTLELISSKGKDGFYTGKTADLIVAEMQRGRGLITAKDLADYRSVWREPIKGTYRGYQIYSMAPPSSGGVLLVQMLNMLEPFDIKASGYGSAATIHLMIEAERRAYADRAEYLGDPGFLPGAGREADRRSRTRKRAFPTSIRRGRRLRRASVPGIAHESPQTTHLSVMDAAGNAVAYTTTLNLSFGSKIVVEGAGFLLNNEMDDFSSRENTPNSYGLIGRVANSIEPGKRMLSSMTPTIVVDADGQTRLVTGSPGGSTIITTVLQVVVNVIDHGMDISDAVGYAAIPSPVDAGSRRLRTVGHFAGHAENPAEPRPHVRDVAVGSRPRRRELGDALRRRSAGHERSAQSRRRRGILRLEKEFWLERWRTNQIGFHQTDFNARLMQHWPTLGVPNDARVFVPLCGKSRDMLWLAQQGHPVLGVELSPTAVEAFFAEATRLYQASSGRVHFTSL